MGGEDDRDILNPIYRFERLADCGLQVFVKLRLTWRNLHHKSNQPVFHSQGAH